MMRRPPRSTLLSLHDALPISVNVPPMSMPSLYSFGLFSVIAESSFEPLVVLEDERDLLVLLRSEEHTSELQSRQYLVCRLLLEKKNINRRPHDPFTCSTASLF